jgi:uncharacterized protein YgbK (DUF1537 family)
VVTAYFPQQSGLIWRNSENPYIHLFGTGSWDILAIASETDFMAPCLFGAIADDYTGGSDLAGRLRERGVRTVQLFGIPSAEDVEAIAGRYEAVVLCLKSRSIDPADARAQSLSALTVLRDFGARQIHFKYCSTFDSTVCGNIGPVTDALLGALSTTFTIAVPALPGNGRTQYLGYLFVGGELLSESPLRHHPLNPMTDSNLVRHLQAQTRRRVGLIELQTVARGPEAIRVRIDTLRSDGIEIALVDAISDFDLEQIAEAVLDLPLITGGSGLGMALPRLWRNQGLLPAHDVETPAQPGPGGTLILSGSCSAATLRQLSVLEEAGYQSIAMDTQTVVEDPDAEAQRLSQASADALASVGIAIVRSSAPVAARAAGEETSHAIEQSFGALAKRLIESNVITRLIVAGGETSGAVVNALGIRAVEVTGTIDPGVPGLRTLSGRPLWLALKSGNFGAPDFFQKTMCYWEQK